MEESPIPGLPYDVSLQILARVPRKYYCKPMSKVSLSWRDALTSHALFAHRKWLRVTESWLYTAVVCEQENRPCVLWFARDVNGEDSEWRALPLMPIEHRPIYGFSCAVIGELLFVIGGFEWQEQSTSFPATNKVSVLNGRTNRWSCVEGMNDARANFACGVVNGKVFVAGGESSVDVGTHNSDSMDDSADCNCLKSSETYDPLTKKWARVEKMIHAMHFVSGGVVDNKFRVCGFVCEGDLQFCEVGEEFEEAEMKWVELIHGESAAGISLFESSRDDESEGEEVFKNESALMASLSNALADVENYETASEDFECKRNPQASLVITL